MRASHFPALLLVAAGMVVAGLAQQWAARSGHALADWKPEASGARSAAAAAADDRSAGGSVLRSRKLRFVALADGREAVLDGNSGGIVRMLGSDPSDQSFLRVTVRVLQEARQARHADIAAPFLLELHDPDGLVLEDPVAGSRLAVRAFGTSAVAALLPLLSAPAEPPGLLPPACPRLEC